MHEIYSGKNRISGNFVATKINPEIRVDPLRKYFGSLGGVGVGTWQISAKNSEFRQNFTRSTAILSISLA